MNLIVDVSDSAFIEEGQKAYLTNVTPQGFSIKLPTLAMKDFMYNWIAFQVDSPTEVKSVSPLESILNQVSTESAVINITPTP